MIISELFDLTKDLNKNKKENITKVKPRLSKFCCFFFLVIWLPETFTFYTLAPSGSPRNLTVHYSTPSATTLRWKPVHKYSINGRLRGYKVKYKETLSTPSSDWSVIVINANGTQQSRNKRSVQEEEIVSFNLEGLKAYTSYTVIVLAFTIKDGVPTLAKNFTTAEMGRFCWDWLINW